MAKSSTARVQSYERISDEEHKYLGFLDEDSLVDHKKKISEEVLKQVIIDAIAYANKKSSRELLEIPTNVFEIDLKSFYRKKGRELFKYFLKYHGDPASSAFDCLNKHFTQIAKESFRNNTIQKERMNSGWRYQHIAKETARLSDRFDSVSDLNLKEADFNAVISYKNEAKKLNIYLSVKNRSNTMGGQDWPKAIHALEAAAVNDKNRDGPYICVFGIAMEKGIRSIKYNRETGRPYSYNTEVWLSEFFWPFFANYSYPEIAKAVLDVLIMVGKQSSLDIEIPEEVINTFGEECDRHGLLDKNGKFDNPHKLVDFFTGNL